MMERDRSAVERYLENLIAQNDLEDLDSWMQMISTAEFAASQNNDRMAEELYKLALQFAEQKMSEEVVINALLCLSSLYKKERRYMEAETAYARAACIFNGLTRSY